MTPEELTDLFNEERAQLFTQLTEQLYRDQPSVRLAASSGLGITLATYYRYRKGEAIVPVPVLLLLQEWVRKPTELDKAERANLVGQLGDITARLNDLAARYAGSQVGSA